MLNGSNNSMKSIIRDIRNRLFLVNKKTVTIRRGANIAGTYFQGYNVVGVRSSVLSSSLGIGTYIGKECYLSFAEIGKFCSIGSYVRFAVGAHPTRTWVSTHPAFFSPVKQSGITFSDKVLFQEKVFADSEHYVVIGNDVWIGDNVTILSGIKIGDGAILAAGSVVTKDVEAYSIVGGSPAKLIRYRFDKPDRDFLLSLKWWDKSMEWIRNNAKYFCNINTLKIHINEDFDNSK